jgi:hypothetical protein
VTEKFIIYDPNQKNPWCNTFLTTTFPYQLIAVPPGIGISHLYRDPKYIEFPLKSKYLLIEHDMIGKQSVDYQRFHQELKNIKFLAHTEPGNLYLNPDSKCE